MKKVLIIGAGLSSSSLIEYLLKNASAYHWHVTVGDISLVSAEAKVADHPHGRSIQFDILEQQQRQTEISQADIVVSMLPGSMHQLVADECLLLGKHLLTPSYVSAEMKKIAPAVAEKGLVFLNELGVDPGIDHMSAMRVIDAIKKAGGKVLSFKSFCGGLVAPACDDNPWKYKFSWNPRNVVVAGQGTAKYRSNGANKYISYNRLFSTLTTTQMPGYGDFEVYPNRDSLQYCQLYGLEDIQTILRGTMRRLGFCEAWDILVQLGCTDDSYVIENSHILTYRQYLEGFLPADNNNGVVEKIADYFDLSPDSTIIDKISWLGFFSDDLINLKDATPAQILQKVLAEKWGMKQQDRDLLVMQHQFEYEIDNVTKQIISSMSYEGQNRENTAMAYTVGLPLAIAVKLIATGKILPVGVNIPTSPEIYLPILDELETLGVKFVEEENLVTQG